MSVTVSIISHGHALDVQRLLDGLSAVSIPLRVILTINSPRLEPSSWLASLHKFSFVHVVLNGEPKGFAENHNNAAKIAQSKYFLVLNPDTYVLNSSDHNIGWEHVLTNLQDLASRPLVGLAYAIQIDGANRKLDFERALVTPWQVIRRLVWTANPLLVKSVDWVSGACMMFRTDIYNSLGGFDERYFLYCEDVDICLRLQLAGFKLSKAQCTIVHATQRLTLKDWQHLTWHLQSLVRLWFSGSFWRYLKCRIFRQSH